MSILFIDELLDELKNDMMGAIKGTGIYETSPQVSRKSHSWEDTKGKRPFIWFTSTDVVWEKMMDDRAHITVEIGIQAFPKPSGYGDSTNLFKLYRDVLRFFYNDYTREFDIISAPLVENGLFEEVGRSEFGIKVHVYIAINTLTMQLI